MGTRKIAASLALALFVGAAGCTADPATSRTQLSVTTLLTWCGGVMPPPGVPACTTSATSRTVAVTKKSSTVAELTTSSEGRGVAAVDPGSYVIVAIGSAAYEDCDSPMVTAIASQTTPVTQTCTVYAP